ncbi:MAG: monovalent cation/H(+) antiporter subunit G [Trueperaceae bacterium]|nr:monovalent cation/H(+) antiporter subunit G [Trueperaceae bacterium]
MLEGVIEIVAGVLILAGAFFVLVSALGLLRLPDLFMRMHAATKAGTLGAGLVLFAAALFFGELAVSIKAAVVFLFLLLTAPVAAHVLGRAAYYAGVTLWDRTMLDELRGKYDESTDEHDGPGAGSPAPSDR